MDDKRFSKIFKAIGDRSRLKIIALLRNGEKSVNEITKAVGLSQSTVSRHLGVLKEAEVVSDRREGQQVYYRLERIIVADCCEGFCDCLEVRINVPKKKKRKK